jgi:hypothetical protein
VSEIGSWEELVDQGPLANGHRHVPVAEVREWLDDHDNDDVPSALKGMVTWYRNQVAEGKARHDALKNAMRRAMEEAAVGAYPAQEAVEAISAAHKQAVAGDRTRARDSGEIGRVTDWAVACAMAMGKDRLAEVRGDLYATPSELADLAEMAAGTAGPGSERGRPGRNGVQAQWHDFGALIAGERKRTIPTLCARADGKALYYLGKENTAYGETETGKDMLLVMTVAECLEKDEDERLSVMWVDFEEGDELDVGDRLLNLGLDPGLLNDRDWFRYATPETKEEADACLRDVLRLQPDLAIFNGVAAAYGLYGWPIKEGDSATAYRKHIIRPCLGRGIGTVSTDHVPKETKESGGANRYAYGGVVKLNIVNGAAYLLKAVSPIVRGGEGATKLILTKDRPGGVKPECGRMKDPAMRYAGMMTVKSSGDGPGELMVSVIPPQPTDGEDSGESEIPDEVFGAVLDVFADAEPHGRSKTTVRDQWKGKNKTLVMPAIEVLENKGYLVEGAKTTRGYKLRVGRPWKEGGDAKFHVSVATD